MTINFSFWKTLWHRLADPRPVKVRTIRIDAPELGRRVRVDVYQPARRQRGVLLPLVLFNDGQDLPGMRIVKRLAFAWRNDLLPPMVIVGIHAGDRLREYGTVSRLDYKGRGDLSEKYEQFLLKTLLPRLYRHFSVSREARHTALAGFSLGGLSAFDIVWRNPERFHTAGVFSGALWWRSSPFDPFHPDADRILHTQVLNSDWRPDLRFWFQAGTADETQDRNRNGVIDAIDDTVQLINILSAKGYRRDIDMVYHEVPGGRHEPATWARVMLLFLRWFAEVKLNYVGLHATLTESEM